MKRFERYWLGLDTTLLRFRAIRYLKVKPVEDPDGRLTYGVTPSPERRTQPNRAARGPPIQAMNLRERSGRMGRSPDVEEWNPHDVIELSSSSSEGHSSEVEMLDLE